MTFVATLVAGPAGALTETLLHRLAALLPGAQQPQWLDKGIAADIIFGGPGFAATAAKGGVHHVLRDAVSPLPIDFIVQPQAKRRKTLLVADMDSTMIGQECIDELADFLGLRAPVASITERAMRGEIAFEPALLERVALLAGLHTDVISQVIAERVTLMPGAQTLVATMRAHGAYTALISGGFTLFTQPIAAMIGFDTHRANELVLEDGKLAGRVKEPILGMAAKLDVLEELCRAQDIAIEDTLAVGDGANDLAMLARAGLGVAFHAKPAVAAAAHARIDHGDLTTLLYAQGYRRSEFCAVRRS